ncbi:helix-turn-helix domain-containing protein [Streptomyces sp. ISL-96]|uniref:helix-turn-helix domain-containing protein n=1 Tax=Streptomyces sp. ISL-96 TaxID=2819191 RepID=UPI001BEB72A0|nr:helix-turn-helix domain-containing protein [Streptomyces sp. ISL-96]MBT2492328.1 helix-turn-helix domain-containing protein [Streptomyces sp. ISL-96]
MITTEEIAAALDGADCSNLAVARTLGVGPERVRRVRAAAGMPPYQRGRRRSCETWEEAFAARTVAVENGHLQWTGPLSEHGTPLLRLGLEAETAYRYAFRIHHGRDAEGKTTPSCGYPRCVAGGHLEDRVIREERRAQEQRQQPRGVLTPPDCATWHKDVDLVAVERVMRGDYPLPELTEVEQRYAVVVMTRDADLGAEEIGERLGIAERTVTRWRAEAGLSDGRP